MALVRGCERAHVNSAPLSRNNGDDCVCAAALAVFVCARLIYIHAITPRSFSCTGRKSDSTPFIGNGHSPQSELCGVTACVLLPVYYRTLEHVMRTVSQRGRQWFGPSGLASRGDGAQTMAALCD